MIIGKHNTVVVLEQCRIWITWDNADLHSVVAFAGGDIRVTTPHTATLCMYCI